MRRIVGALCAGFLLSLRGWGEAAGTRLKAVIEMDAGKIVIEFYKRRSGTVATS
jgi:hypothetical protein